MTTPPAADDADESADSNPITSPAITPSPHAKLRSQQGRPIGRVINDVQRAGPQDVFVQPEDNRFVVRGPNAREHVIEPDGEHVTSIQPRTDSAHKARLRDGTIRPASLEEFQRLKDMGQ